jgi:C-terminal processing protease CtpA/Prc
MQGPFRITYSHSGKKDSLSLQALPRQMLFSNLSAVRGSARTSLPSYEFSRIENNIGYLNFRSMTDPREFDYFIDSVFNGIKVNPVNALIIDLRRNGGGNSALGDRLLSHITTKKYRMAGGMKWKISQQYKDHYNSLPEEMRFLRGKELEKNYMKGKNGKFIEEMSELVTPKERANRYNGNVYFLIGPNTYSSANMLANAVKDFQLATLIGEPTGECPNDYGELINLKLPNTGITFFTSTRQYIRANGDANDRSPVLPDHFIKDDPATPADEVLEFTVKRSQGRN